MTIRTNFFPLAGHTIAALLAGVAMQTAQAAWPEKQISLIVPWAAGGTTDILARTVADQLGRALGQPVLVENKAGASGNIGSLAVVRAKPDGYTILFGSMSTHAMNPALMRRPCSRPALVARARGRVDRPRCGRGCRWCRPPPMGR